MALPQWKICWWNASSVPGSLEERFRTTFDLTVSLHRLPAQNLIAIADYED
jgi:hypothetical protein